MSVGGQSPITRVGTESAAGYGRYNSVRRRYLADDAGNQIIDVNVAGTVYRHTDGRHRCIDGWASIAIRTSERRCLAVPSDSRDNPCRRGNHTDPAVRQVDHVHVAEGVHRHTPNAVEFGAGGRSAIPRKTGNTVSSECCDHTCRRDLTHYIVAGIRDIEVAGAVHRHTQRSEEFGVDSRASISRVARDAIAGHRRDDSCLGGNLADARVPFVCDVEVPRAIHRHGLGQELGIHSGAPVAGVTQGVVTNHRRDDTGRDRHFSDTVVTVVADVQVPCGVRSDPLGAIQAGGGGQPSVSRKAWSRRIARHARQYAVGIHLEYAVVGSEIKVATRIHRHRLDTPKRGAHGENPARRQTASSHGADQVSLCLTE